MNRFVIGSLGVVSILLAAFGVGCVGVSSTETAEEGIVSLSDDDSYPDVGADTDTRLGRSGRSVVHSNVDPTRKGTANVCAGCGPVPDPWANGPVPDPWSDPSSSSSSSGSTSGSGGSNPNGKH